MRETNKVDVEDLTVENGLFKSFDEIVMDPIWHTTLGKRTKQLVSDLKTLRKLLDYLVRAENYNTSAVEFLRRLPGVTDSNDSTIMDGCKSLAELSLLPVEKLAVLMVGQQASRTLKRVS